MKKHNKIICGSFAALLALVGLGASADMRAGKAGGYAGSSKNLLALQQQYQNQVAAAEAAAAAAAAEEERNRAFAVEVADKELEEKIRDGDDSVGITRNTLDACASIYPGAEFVWDVPNMGAHANGPATCVAVVEMRFLGKAQDGGELAVARAKVAAGDTIDCNIFKFPKQTYLPAMANVGEFPADEPPTREEVIKVMNQEQKNKAGLKIAAGLLVGGLGGNLSGKNDPGKDGMLGTSKSKLKNTAIGAAGGAALMAASTFSGKVAGDMILHGGVNAMAGGAVGNMMGVGDSVLRVEKCKTEAGVETTCLWGHIEDTEEETDKTVAVFYNYLTKKLVKCKREGGDKGPFRDCSSASAYKAKTVKGNAMDVSDFDGKSDKASLIVGVDRYNLNEEDLKNGKKVNLESDQSGPYVEVSVLKRKGGAKKAVVLGFTEKKMGSKMDDWHKWVGENSGATVCLRDNDGNPYKCSDSGESGALDEKALENFSPNTLDADNGEIIDLSNKARLGATLKGAGVGAAAGGFSGYQGAQSDIDARLNQAKDEYEASLQKVYCGSGSKFLNFYNDEVIIPSLRE